MEHEVQRRFQIVDYCDAGGGALWGFIWQLDTGRVLEERTFADFSVGQQRYCSQAAESSRSTALSIQSCRSLIRLNAQRARLRCSDSTATRVAR